MEMMAAPMKSMNFMAKPRMKSKKRSKPKGRRRGGENMNKGLKERK